MEFLPIRPASRLGRDAGSAAPAERTEASPPCRLTIRGQPALHVRTGGIHENRFVLSFGGSSRLRRRTLVLRQTAPGHSGHPGSSHALERHQQRRSQRWRPVCRHCRRPRLPRQPVLLPAGTRVNGIIGTVEKARRFSIFRGQAYMNLTFRSIEVDSRLIPVQMSLIAIEQPRGQAGGTRRKDVKIEEGQVVQEKHDIKGDIVGATMGTGGGTLIGAVFSHVARGFGFGLAGSAVYVVARKGKDLDLPAQTGMLIRMDNTITVPVTSASNTFTTGSR